MRLIDADALECNLGSSDEHINFKDLIQDTPTITILQSEKVQAISESIFDGKNVIVPMADVNHIEKRDGGILVIMNGTRWNFVNDTWDGGVWIGEVDDQSKEFLKSWCYYRYEVDIKIGYK